jgi:hypothetical protein
LKKIIAISICLYLLLILTTGCTSNKNDINDEKDKNDEKIKKLSIEYFIVKPGLINVGYSANLTWRVTGATNISIDKNIGPVDSEGWYIIFPKVETTYTLTASNHTTEIVASTTIYVLEDSNEPKPNIFMTENINENICIITIDTITEPDILWVDTKYTLIDVEIMNLITSEIIYPNSGFIKSGDIITINNLNKNHKYRFSITYKPSDFSMGSISWIQ